MVDCWKGSVKVPRLMHLIDIGKSHQVYILSRGSANVIRVLPCTSRKSEVSLSFSSKIFKGA